MAHATAGGERNMAVVKALTFLMFTMFAALVHESEPACNDPNPQARHRPTA